MSVLRIANPDRVRPSHVVLIALVYLALLGGFLLTCAPERAWLPDGAKHWQEDSLLPAVVELLNLNYSRPTVYGDDIKLLVAGLGAGLAALVFGISVAAQARRGDEIEESDLVVEDVQEQDRVNTLPVTKRQIPPLFAAQGMLCLYVLWSFASALWSGEAWSYAVSGSFLLGIYAVWAFGLGFGLNRISAKKASMALLVAAIAAAVIAMWYVQERNNVKRAEYPFGNPLVLAACLLPGLCIALSIAGHGLSSALAHRRSVGWVEVIGGLLLLLVVGWAFFLTDSRGPAIGLAGGVFTLIWLSLTRKARIGMGVLGAVAVLAVGVYGYSRISGAEDAGRQSTIQTRLYAWQYAIDLASESAILGNGQGAYVLRADAFAANDVGAAPLPLEFAIRHAHNEYLEIFADLGAIGAILFLGMLVMTFKAVLVCLPTLPTRTLRWTLSGLAAALVAMSVSECFGVSLRFAGLPLPYYTVIGLIWAICADPRKDVRTKLQKPAWRYLTLVIAAVLGLGAIEVSRADFRAARSSYKVVDAVEKTDWERALELSDIAYRRRLSPQRRLGTEQRRVETRLKLAAFYRSQAQSLVAEARQSTDPSGTLVSAAMQKMLDCEAVTTSALGELETLVEKAPACWASGWLEFQLRNILIECAVLKQDAEMHEQNIVASIESLKKEIQRRPFDPVIAVTAVGFMSQKAPLEDLFILIARPMRYDLPRPEYYTLLSQMNLPEAELDALLDTALQALETDSPEDWQHPLAPEILRLLAMVDMNNGDRKDAIEKLEQAYSLYQKLDSDAQIGEVMCLKELADAQYYENPADPQRVMDTANTVVKDAPASGKGRQVAVQASDRMIPCSLIKGDEQSVRNKIVQRMHPGTPEETINVVLGTEYTKLAKTILVLEATDLYDRIEEWLLRAIELYPEDVDARMVRAHFAFLNGDDKLCADQYREALNLGAYAEPVVRSVQTQLVSRPDSEPLQALWAQFVEAFGVPTFEEMMNPATQPASGPSSQPATTPASQPIIETTATQPPGAD